MSDDRRSQELLTEALAGQRIYSRLMSPHETGTADVVIEVTDVGSLGALLGELHSISPQVLVSSADQVSPLTTARRPRNTTLGFRAQAITSEG